MSVIDKRKSLFIHCPSLPFSVRTTQKWIVNIRKASSSTPFLEIQFLFDVRLYVLIFLHTVRIFYRSFLQLNLVCKYPLWLSDTMVFLSNSCIILSKLTVKLHNLKMNTLSPHLLNTSPIKYIQTLYFIKSLLYYTVCDLYVIMYK